MAAVPLVEENSLCVTETGYQIQVRLPWYRSLPLSCIEKVHMSLDGQPIDPDLLRFGINDRQFRLSELDELIEEYWFVQDAACLSVLQLGKIARGASHTIEFELTLRFPYIAIGPGKFLVNTNKHSVTQVAS
jgi:hypothetical protein